MFVGPVIVYGYQLHKLDTGIAAGEPIMIRLKLNVAKC